MDLRTNICDSIKECEIKLGYQEKVIHLYYPESALLELLDAKNENLVEKITSFCQVQAETFGDITVTKTQDEGRYCIDVPAKGVKYVHENIMASPFMVAFVREIHKPGKKQEDIVKLFSEFSEDVVVEKIEEHEWAMYFRNGVPDAYIYYIEEDDFGLQYHRFTRETFRKMNQLVIVINGSGEAGKDTICEIVGKYYKTMNISSVDPIKKIAYENGWNGEKNAKSRKFLADLKQLFVDFNDLPYQYLMDKYQEFSESDKEILFVHIREPKEISKFKESIGKRCITLLIRRRSQVRKEWNNAADDEVENYDYDFSYDNIKGLDEVESDFMSFFRLILN